MWYAQWNTHVCVPRRFSHVRHFVTPWTVAWQAPLSMGLSRQEYWSGLPRPSPGDLPDCSLPRRISEQVCSERQKSASLLKF